MFTNSYNPQRQLLLVGRQLALFQQPWLIAAAAVLGALLIISVITAVFNPTGLYGIQNLYPAAFFFGGLIFTSQIFKELHSPQQSYFYLTLPASTLEKLVAAWLLTSPLYILSFILLSFIPFFISFLIAGVPFSLSQFFTDVLGETVISYLVVQTIFLWGACYFRKNNFLKTALSLVILGICLAMYLGLVVWLLFETNGQAQINSEEIEPILENLLTRTVEILFWGVLGPYMLLMAYFTLKEREV